MFTREMFRAVMFNAKMFPEFTGVDVDRARIPLGLEMTAKGYDVESDGLGYGITFEPPRWDVE